MHDETSYQAVVATAEGPEGVAGAGGVPSTEAPEGEARAGRVPEGEARAGRVPEGEVTAEQAQTTGVGFEIAAARRSLEAAMPEIEAVDPADVERARFDPQKVAALVITLLWRDSKPARRKKFERFAAQGDYDITLLERLPELARAVWYLRRQQQRVLYLVAGPALSEEERVKAFELRAHWMSELTYYCDDMPEVLAELEYLRKGAGHQDLANDLETLLELSNRPDVRARLEKSRKYRPEAAAEALRLAELLLRSLGVAEEGEAERLTGQLQRAVTLMLRWYEKHSVRGKFLFHEVEDVEATYPSLYAASRSPRRKRREEGEGGSGGEGGDDEPQPG